MKPFSTAIAGACLSLTIGGTASADVIDGIWCQADGRTLSIDGPTIVTPGGSTIQGEYARHYFYYTVPAPEAEAGASVMMELVNETTVALYMRPVNGPSIQPEVWRRCEPVASLPAGPTLSPLA